MEPQAKVLIVGAGFGGLAAAKALGNTDADVTVVDHTNHHLFPPLLYQVATAALSPSDVASATRSLLAHYKNVTVRLDGVVRVDAGTREAHMASGASLGYDFLVLVTGCGYSSSATTHGPSMPRSSRPFPTPSVSASGFCRPSSARKNARIRTRLPRS